MTSPASETFVQLIEAIFERYYRQNDFPPPVESEKAAVAARLWRIVEQRGTPPLPAKAEPGEPAEMTAEEVTSMVAELLKDLGSADILLTPARQLVKACFQAERRECRESYREAGANGVCRRQELARVRERVSGTHCVDCPHWTALTPDEHEKFLAKAWRPARAEEFATHRGVFLPEDFRSLKVWLRNRAGG